MVRTQRFPNTYTHTATVPFLAHNAEESPTTDGKFEHPSRAAGSVRHFSEEARGDSKGGKSAVISPSRLQVGMSSAMPRGLPRNGDDDGPDLDDGMHDVSRCVDRLVGGAAGEGAEWPGRGRMFYETSGQATGQSNKSHNCFAGDIDPSSVGCSVESPHSRVGSGDTDSDSSSSGSSRSTSSASSSSAGSSSDSDSSSLAGSDSDSRSSANTGTHSSRFFSAGADTHMHSSVGSDDARAVAVPGEGVKDSRRAPARSLEAGQHQLVSDDEDGDQTGAAFRAVQRADASFARLQREATALAIQTQLRTGGYTRRSTQQIEPPAASTAASADATAGVSPVDFTGVIDAAAASAPPAASAATAPSPLFTRPQPNAPEAEISAFVSLVIAHLRQPSSNSESRTRDWCMLFNRATVVTCFDWLVPPRIRDLIPSMKLASRDQQTVTVDTLHYYARLCRAKWAAVDIRQPGDVAAKAAAQQYKPLHLLDAADFEAMAATIEAVIAKGGPVDHLVLFAQAPIQKYWCKHIAGIADMVSGDDTFGASRDDSSFGTLMGYAPAWGLHVPVAFYVLMYKQGCDGEKTSALSWMMRQWREMGNASPRVWQFDGDAASVNAVTADTIHRMLTEIPAMLASSAASGLVSLAQGASEAQIACTSVLRDALRSDNIERAQIEVNDAYTKLLSSSPSSPPDVSAPMLQSHLRETPAMQPLIAGIANAVLRTLVDAAKSTADLVGKTSKAATRAPEAAAQFSMALDELLRVVSVPGAESHGVSEALERTRTAANELLRYDLKVRWKVFETDVLEPAHARVQAFVDSSDSFGDWCLRLLSTKCRICEFHVRKAWNDNLSGHFSGDKAAKQAAMDELRALSMCRTIADRDTHWIAFKEKYAGNKPKLVDYVYNTWIDPNSVFAGLWEAFTRPFPHYLIDTTNSAEVCICVILLC